MTDDETLSRQLPSKDWYVTRIADGKQYAWFGHPDKWLPLTEQLKAGNTPVLMTYSKTQNWFSDVTAYKWQGNPYAPGSPDSGKRRNRDNE